MLIEAQLYQDDEGRVWALYQGQLYECLERLAGESDQDLLADGLIPINEKYWVDLNQGIEIEIDSHLDGLKEI